MIFITLIPLLCALQEEVFIVTLLFERVHCDECKAEVEAIAKKSPGFKAINFSETSAAVTLEEKAPVPAFGGMPKDMGFSGVKVTLRGMVNVTDDKTTFVAKGSGQTFALANPAQPPKDHIGELKKKLGGKNRFQVTGSVAGKRLILSGFQTTDWKD
jgi:copper chaperone CopZ